MNVPVVFARLPGVHLVRPHRSRPILEGRSRVRSICGRSGTVVAEAARAAGLCTDCHTIERIA